MPDTPTPSPAVPRLFTEEELRISSPIRSMLPGENPDDYELDLLNERLAKLPKPAKPSRQG
jgi:hypothetical protein